MASIRVQMKAGYIMTISGRNLDIFDFLGNKMMAVKKHKARIVNYDLVLLNNETKK